MYQVRVVRVNTVTLRVTYCHPESNIPLNDKQSLSVSSRVMMNFYMMNRSTNNKQMCSFMFKILVFQNYE